MVPFSLLQILLPFGSSKKGNMNNGVFTTVCKQYVVENQESRPVRKLLLDFVLHFGDQVIGSNEESIDFMLRDCTATSRSAITELQRELLVHLPIWNSSNASE